MIILGITGGMGTGKTTAAKMFADFGAKVIDADKIAHSVVKPGSGAWRKLISVFGKEIITEGGKINRRKVAEIVFQKEPDRLKELNSIIHPEVVDIILKRMQDAKLSGTDVVVIDAPLLIEAGLSAVIDRLVVVSTGRKIQEKRSSIQHKLSLKEIRARISSQLSLAEKEKKADYVIDNNGSPDNTRKQVEKIWREIR